MDRQQILVVDMAIPDKMQLAQTIRKASIETGFFYLINHGIDQNLIDEVFLQSKQFFDLPLDEKLKTKYDKNHRGYTPMLGETLDPENSLQGDTKEGFYIGLDVQEGDPLSAWPFNSPNQWPSEEKLRGWRETMEKYYDEATNLGHRVNTLFALALDLDPNFFKNMFTRPMAALRPLHYEADISNPAEGRFGSGAHSDFGFLTFLATDNNPGLQICRDKGAVPQVWEDVVPMKGAFIMNLGDMLERWTNGLFRSTLHRVITQGVDRYSVPFFYGPNYDTLVECLPTCCSPTNPPKHPPITHGGYLLERLMATRSRDPNAKKV